jgi:Transposase DDE domain group 1
VNGNSTVRVGIESGDSQVVAHVGLHALGAFADRLGFGSRLSEQVPWTGERPPVHDRGTVLTQAMLMLAGGGESCADIEHLRTQDRLFGRVPSDTTVYRTLTAIDSVTLAGLSVAARDTRAVVWARSDATAGPVVLDIDASLVEIHSENKEGTAPHFKRGFGFHPMFCFADATGETLASLLRPGNAAANDAADHLTVLDAAIDQLPDQVAAGHRVGDEPSLAARPVMVRADSAGCTRRFITGCRERNIGFGVVARQNSKIHGVIGRLPVDDDRWTVTERLDGAQRHVGHVGELTDLIDLDGWPDGTRLIVRREKRHPGAQRSLFPSETFRYWGHYTDQTGEPVELDEHMRAHAHVEDHIRRLKASGLERFPFRNLDANRAWLALIAMAADLVRWFQLLCCTGAIARAEPKRMRWSLWHTPARVVRRAGRDIVRIIAGWPTTTDLADAYAHIAALT